MENITFDTLDAALAHVAGHGFDSELTVTPNDDHTFTVREDWHNLPEEITWTYARGIEFPNGSHGVSEHTRLFEPYETWSGRPFASADASGYVRRGLPESVDALTSGHAVTFGFGTVDASESSAYCQRAEYVDTDGSCDCDTDDCQCDRLCGWIAVARIWDESL